MHKCLNFESHQEDHRVRFGLQVIIESMKVEKKFPIFLNFSLQIYVQTEVLKCTTKATRLIWPRCKGYVCLQSVVLKTGCRNLNGHKG